MEKFMLLIREDLKRLRKSTEEERLAEMLEMFEWTKWIAESGNYVHSEPLGYQEGTLVKRMVYPMAHSSNRRRASPGTILLWRRILATLFLSLKTVH